MLVRLNSGPERAGRAPGVSSTIFQVEVLQLSPRPGPGQWEQPETGWNQETASAPTSLCDLRKSPPLCGLQFPDCKPGINTPLLPPRGPQRGSAEAVNVPCFGIQQKLGQGLGGKHSAPLLSWKELCVQSSALRLNQRTISKTLGDRLCKSSRTS